MRLDPEEIAELAAALAPLLADELERRLSERPEWAMSIGEAAAWLNVPDHVVRKAVADKRLPVVRIGRSVRIRRADLFRARPNGQQPDGDDGG